MYLQPLQRDRDHPRSDRRGPQDALRAVLVLQRNGRMGRGRQQAVARRAGAHRSRSKEGREVTPLDFMRLLWMAPDHMTAAQLREIALKMMENAK